MTKLRAAIAQINTTVGDLRGNTAKIIEYIDRARAEGADLVSFPELTITGYPPKTFYISTTSFAITASVSIRLLSIRRGSPW